VRADRPVRCPAAAATGPPCASNPPCSRSSTSAAAPLKAIAHFGEVAHKHVRGLHELAGEPVILLHRLLKNQVAAPRYVLMSAAFRDLLDDDPGPLAEAVEHPDGFEPLRVFVRAPAQAPAAGLNVNATPFMQ
jgi:hypothetical protein